MKQPRTIAYLRVSTTDSDLDKNKADILPLAHDDGTFAKGNSGGTGRPPRRIEAHYLVAMSEIVSPEDWQEIVSKAVQDAKQGDKDARNWLARYLLGETASNNNKRPNLTKAHMRVDKSEDDIERESMMDGYF